MSRQVNIRMDDADYQVVKKLSAASGQSITRIMISLLHQKQVALQVEAQIQKLADTLMANRSIGTDSVSGYNVLLTKTEFRAFNRSLIESILPVLFKVGMSEFHPRFHSLQSRLAAGEFEGR